MKKQIDKNTMTELEAVKKLGRIRVEGDELPAIMGILNKKTTTPIGVPVCQRGDSKPSGKTTGRAHRCRMEGCSGWRIVVRWNDGTTTHPCSKGMVLSKKGWRIL